MNNDSYYYSVDGAVKERMNGFLRYFAFGVSCEQILSLMKALLVTRDEEFKAQNSFPIPPVIKQNTFFYCAHWTSRVHGEGTFLSSFQ